MSGGDSCQGVFARHRREKRLRVNRPACDRCGFYRLGRIGQHYRRNLEEQNRRCEEAGHAPTLSWEGQANNEAEDSKI